MTLVRGEVPGSISGPAEAGFFPQTSALPDLPTVNSVPQNSDPARLPSADAFHNMLNGWEQERILLNALRERRTDVVKMYRPDFNMDKPLDGLEKSTALWVDKYTAVDASDQEKRDAFGQIRLNTRHIVGQGTEAHYEDIPNLQETLDILAQRRSEMPDELFFIDRSIGKHTPARLYRGLLEAKIDSEVKAKEAKKTERRRHLRNLVGQIGERQLQEAQDLELIKKAREAQSRVDRRKAHIQQARKAA